MVVADTMFQLTMRNVYTELGVHNGPLKQSCCRANAMLLHAAITRRNNQKEYPLEHQLFATVLHIKVANSGIEFEYERQVYFFAEFPPV